VSPTEEGDMIVLRLHEDIQTVVI